MRLGRAASPWGAPGRDASLAGRSAAISVWHALCDALGARRPEVWLLADVFPSLAFFEALKRRTVEDAPVFEKLGYCDTSFGVKLDEDLYAIHFEVYECVRVEAGGDPAKLDFVLAAPRAVWCEMVESIVRNRGADAAHTLNTLSHVGDVVRVEYEDAEGHDRFYRYMASIQEFFDQARHLDVEVRR
jgi:hypothetical protein